MSKRQAVALKVSLRRESESEKKERQHIDLRCVEGLRNYQRLKEIFPWLEEERESYL